MASQDRNIVRKLAIRERTGCWKRHMKQPCPVLFEKIPSRMCYQLKRLVSHTVLENGHVFLGFSKCGRFVVSYSLQVGGEQTNDQMLPVYDYKLQWWLFIPNKPLQLVSEVKLFGGDDIFRELFIAFCEWPEDHQKVFVYGQSIPSAGEDSCFCYVTITSVPNLGKCADCQNEREKPCTGSSINENALKLQRKCLLHGLCVHSKYDMNPPYPAFSPNVQLKLNGTAILNTGISLVAFQVQLPHSKHKLSTSDKPFVGQETVIGNDLSLTVLKTINTFDSVTSSPNLKIKSCQECQTSQCSSQEYEENNIDGVTLCCHNVPINSPTNSGGLEFVGDSESIVSIEIDKVKEYKICDNCNQLINDCTCPKIIRQPLQDKNGGGISVRNLEQSTNNISVSSPRATVSTRHSHENLLDPLNDFSHSSQIEKTSNYVFSSPSPRVCSERSFFSHSNSNSSVTSKSSEGVHVHTNLAKTVTYSSRCYGNHQGEITDSQISMEDEYDLAYRSILPVDVEVNGKALSVAKNVCVCSDVISVLQMTFDIEPYMMETIHLRAEWGRRFVSFYNYDLQILDVEQDGQVLGMVYALIQAKESNEKSKRHSKIPSKMYRTMITFSLNLCKGVYSTLNIEDLSEVQERNPYEFEWKFGNKECNAIRRKALMPKSFFRSVHMLSNECLFKGRSKKILMASHHSHSSAIIL